VGRYPDQMASDSAIHLTVPSGESYDALIFDWDGTLVDSRDLNHRALESALRECGVVLDPRWYWQRQGIASPDMLVEWESTFGPLPEPIDVIIQRCRGHVIAGASTVVVIEDIADVARRAHQRGQRLGIGSNSAASTLRASMRATGLACLFQAAVSWSDVAPGRGKPAPDILLLVAERLGVDPAGCLVYEDAVEGVAAAKTAGMAVYNVRTGEMTASFR
jgi:beta-phosphoglucomutase-like phosphatase (HAD superfamily)